MATKFGYDIPECPTQNIIGSPVIEGRCFYDGRPQGQKIYAKTARRVKKILSCKIKKLKELHSFCYHDDAKWEMRIYI